MTVVLVVTVIAVVLVIDTTVENLSFVMFCFFDSHP